MQRFERLTEKAKAFYDNGDPSHDFAHVGRVLQNCRVIATTVGANLELLLPAALLHDVVNLPKDHHERKSASEMAARKAQDLLTETGYSADEIAQIKTIITEHSFSRGMKPSCIESAVLQDADKLDAVGAIGVMRAVTCGSRMGSSYYNVTEPFVRERELDDKTYTIDHFFSKLLKLPEMMNTEAAKSEAHKRAEFMRIFLEELNREIC